MYLKTRELLRPKPRTNDSVRSMLSALISGTSCFRSQATDGLPMTWNIKQRRLCHTSKTLRGAPAPLITQPGVDGRVCKHITSRSVPEGGDGVISHPYCSSAFERQKNGVPDSQGDKAASGIKNGASERASGRASYLAVVADTAVRRGQHLRCRRSQVAGAHDAGLGDPEAED